MYRVADVCVLSEEGSRGSGGLVISIGDPDSLRFF